MLSKSQTGLPLNVTSKGGKDTHKTHDRAIALYLCVYTFTDTANNNILFVVMSMFQRIPLLVTITTIQDLIMPYTSVGQYTGLVSEAP